jgi:RNA polymerase sigma-70 factor (ECF subfamily)
MMNPHVLQRSDAGGRRRFLTTRWSLVISAANSATPNQALTELCEAYWYPAYAYLRRANYPADKAEDLTQAFFTRMIEKQFLRDANQERGRFRSFLLASLRHFALNEYDRERAQRRGGHVAHVALDFEDGERRYLREPADDLTPDLLYERRWVNDVLRRTLSRLAEEWRKAGRERMFNSLKPRLVGDEPRSYQSLAYELCVSEGSLRVAVHRLRQEFGAMLREIIAETVERDEDIDDELRFLLSVLERRP